MDYHHVTRDYHWQILINQENWWNTGDIPCKIMTSMEYIIYIYNYIYIRHIHLFFSPIVGMMIQSDFHIFSEGLKPPTRCTYTHMFDLYISMFALLLAPA
jgi:hypothetical protein